MSGFEVEVGLVGEKEAEKKFENMTSKMLKGILKVEEEVKTFEQVLQRAFDVGATSGFNSGLQKQIKLLGNLNGQIVAFNKSTQSQVQASEDALKQLRAETSKSIVEEQKANRVKTETAEALLKLTKAEQQLTAQKDSQVSQTRANVAVLQEELRVTRELEAAKAKSSANVVNLRAQVTAQKELADSFLISRVAANSYSKELRELGNRGMALADAIRKTGTATKEQAAALRQNVADIKAYNSVQNVASKGVQDHIAKLRQLEAQQVKTTVTTRNLRSVTGLFRNVLDGLKTHVSVYTGGMIGAAAATYGTARAVKFAVDAFAQFEVSMQRVAAVTSATVAEQEKMYNYVLDVAKGTVFTATETADAMVQLGMAGLSPNEAMTALIPTLKLASIGMISFGKAADISTNIMQGFGFNAGDLSMVADVMAQAITDSNATLEQMGNTLSYVAPVASAFGVSLQAATSAAEVLHNAGIKASRAGTGLRRILLGLYTPTRKGAEALDDIGVKTKTFDGNTRSLIAVLGDLANALDTGKATIADLQDVVGVRALPAFVRLVDSAKMMTDEFGNASSSILEFYQTQLRAAGAAASMQSVIEDTLSADWKKLIAAFEVLGIKLLEIYSDDVRDGLVSLTEWIMEITESPEDLQDLADSIENVAIAVGSLAAISAAIVSVGALKSLFGILGGRAAAGVAGSATSLGGAYGFAGLVAAAAFGLERLETAAKTALKPVEAIANLLARSAGLRLALGVTGAVVPTELGDSSLGNPVEALENEQKLQEQINKLIDDRIKKQDELSKITQQYVDQALNVSALESNLKTLEGMSDGTVAWEQAINSVKAALIGAKQELSTTEEAMRQLNAAVVRVRMDELGTLITKTTREILTHNARLEELTQQYADTAAKDDRGVIERQIGSLVATIAAKTGDVKAYAETWAMLEAAMQSFKHTQEGMQNIGAELIPIAEGVVKQLEDYENLRNLESLPLNELKEENKLIASLSQEFVQLTAKYKSATAAIDEMAKKYPELATATKSATEALQDKLMLGREYEDRLKVQKRLEEENTRAVRRAGEELNKFATDAAKAYLKIKREQDTLFSKSDGGLFGKFASLDAAKAKLLEYTRNISQLLEMAEQLNEEMLANPSVETYTAMISAEQLLQSLLSDRRELQAALNKQEKELYKDVDKAKERLAQKKAENDLLEASLKLNTDAGKVREQATYILLKEALATENLAKLTKDEIDAKLQLIEVQQKLAQQEIRGNNIAAREEARKKFEEDWKRTINSISDSLTDALMRGFEDGKGFAENFRDVLINMFKTMVLRPTIEASISAVFSSAGAGSSGSGGALDIFSAGSKAWDLLSGNSFISNVGSFLGLTSAAVPTSTLAAGGSLITAGSSAIGTGTAISAVGSGTAGVGAGAAGLGSASLTGASAGWLATIGSFAAVALPVIGAVFAIAEFFKDEPDPQFGLGHKGGKYAQDTPFGNFGLTYSNDFDDTELAKFTKAVADLDTFLAGLFEAADVENAREAMADWEFNKIDPTDQTSWARILHERYGKIIAAMDEELAQIFWATGGADSLQELEANLEKVISIWMAYKTDFQGFLSDLNDMSLTDFNQFVEDLGGLQAFEQSALALGNIIYTEEERIARARQSSITTLISLNKVLLDNGQSAITSRETLREVAEGLDLTTEAGQEMYAMLLQAIPAFELLADQAEKLADIMTSVDDEIARLTQSEFAYEMNAVVRWMEETIASAKALGASQEELSRIQYLAYLKQQEIIEGLKDSITSLVNDLYGGIITNTSYIDAAITAERERLSDAKAAAEELYRAEMERYEDAQRAIEQIGKYLLDMKIGPLSPYVPMQQQVEAQYSYEDALANAGQGDQFALANLTQFAQTYLQQSRDVYGATGQYSNIFAGVQEDLYDLVMKLNLISEPGDIGDYSTSDLLKMLEEERRRIIEEKEAEDRKLAAIELVLQLKELGLATDQGILDLAAQFGIDLDALAKDLGLNLEDLNIDLVKAIKELVPLLGYSFIQISTAFGVDLKELAESLGFDLETYNKTLAQQLVLAAIYTGEKLVDVADVLGVDLDRLSDAIGFDLDSYGGDTAAAIRGLAGILGFDEDLVAQAIYGGIVDGNGVVIGSIDTSGANIVSTINSVFVGAGGSAIEVLDRIATNTRDTYTQVQTFQTGALAEYTTLINYLSTVATNTYETWQAIGTGGGVVTGTDNTILAAIRTNTRDTYTQVQTFQTGALAEYTQLSNKLSAISTNTRDTYLQVQTFQSGALTLYNTQATRLLNIQTYTYNTWQAISGLSIGGGGTDNTILAAIRTNTRDTYVQVQTLQSGAATTLPKLNTIATNSTTLITGIRAVNNNMRGLYSHFTGLGGWSFASGLGYVPEDMVAQIHQGEMILDATAANMARKYGLVPSTAANDSQDEDAARNYGFSVVYEGNTEVVERLDAVVETLERELTLQRQETKRLKAEVIKLKETVAKPIVDEMCKNKAPNRRCK